MKYQEELEFAKTLALRAGERIVSGFSKSTVTVKSNLTPVTETDIAVSKMVIEAVKRRFPGHAVVDEELQHDYGSDPFVWVCDPIDGTVPFSYHIPTSVFSLALCHNGEPVVSVIYDPYMKRLLWTAVGEPSFANDANIRVRTGGLIAGDFIYGIPYWNMNFDTNKYIRTMFAKDIRVSYVESIVYQSMLVALGLTPALVTIAASPWDRAAAIQIIENAGGTCTDEHGRRLTAFGDPKLFIATNGTIHDEIMSVVSSCFV